MSNSVTAVIRFAAAWCLLGMLASAQAAPPSAEDRYIAARDTAIAKISKLYDESNGDEAAKAEKAADADLLAQMKAILAEPDRKGFGPAKLNLDGYNRGDEGFGALDGLRFDAELGDKGEQAGGNGADGKYVEPKAHIIVTTQTLFERWLREHKEWWDKGVKNVPQQIGAALRAESFYTQAISSGSAVVSFSALPVTRPAASAFAYAMLAGRTQSEVPNAADKVFVSALANGKVYIAYGSIKPKVQVTACLPKRGDYSQKAEDAYKRCFAQRAPQQPAFAEATRQAQALLAAAMAK